jgi:hypothetical protein
MYTVYGICTGNYFNCSCNFVSPGERTGGIIMRKNPLNPDPEWEIWWRATNLPGPTYENCATCTPNTGVKEIVGTYVDDYIDYEIISCEY